jgi:hypothetical protein
MGSLELQATSWLRQGPCEGERSQITMLESGVRRKAPAPFGAGERLQSPTYRYCQKAQSKQAMLLEKEQEERGRGQRTSTAM